ncbi:MAG: CRISPR-associated endonuclease Cas1 [Rhodospirillales bacterium]|nr:CRISPR-associated endonuclease Cas1 [Rhodospirillales bacterium]
MIGQSPSLFASVCSAHTLTMGWAKVRANKGGPGGDGETLWDFRAQAGPRIERLARELMGGDYRPGPLRAVDVPKRSGGTRTLSIPCVVDRVAQTAAAMVLGPVLEPEFEDSSFAYRPGRSVERAVARVSALYRDGYRYVVDGDIRAYFDSIPHAPLVARLEAIVDDERLIDLIELWLEGFDEDGVGIPQGSPISPLLANLYLDAVDERIERRGVRLVRYADDFVLLCRSESRAAGALERMAALLAEHGLELHPEKTRIVRFENGFTFLGRLFVRSLVVKTDPDEAAPEVAASEPDPPWNDAAVAEERPPGDVVPFPMPAAAANAGVAEPEEPPEPVVTIPREVSGSAAVASAAHAPAEPPAEPPPADLRAELGAAPHGRFAPILAPLYVMESGRRIDLRNEALVVLEGEVELLALPPGRVDRIEVGPYVEIAQAAIRQAMAWRIPVAMVDGHGEAIGSIEPKLVRRAGLHLAQAGCVLDPARRLALARILVEGRLRSQQKKLKKLNQDAHVERVEDAAEEIFRLSRRAAHGDGVDQVMGFEGAATRRYWPALGALLKHGWRLGKRTRRPPADAVNAVISWLSAMLTRDVHALVLRRGLHPGFAALHGSYDGHDGALYDVVEEFRAPLAEGPAVGMFNRRRLREEHFYVDGEGRVRINRQGRTVVIRAYEAGLDREIKSQWRDGRTTWRGVMEEQVDAYARHMLGEETYRPYDLDY